jgi:tRNA (adenine37-N6)-methyltransferase
LKGIRGAVLEIEDVDIADGTPLLDIKPFVPEFDNRFETKTGWLKGKSRHVQSVKADKRFAEK